MNKKPSLFSVVGRKGSGKAQVIEALIAVFKERGQRVGLIKHLSKPGVEIEAPEKDTYRYRQCGAETVMVSGKNQRAVFSNVQEEMPLEKMLSFFEEFDLVLLEGYFLKEIPMIEVYKKELGSPLSAGMENAFAVCSDVLTPVSVPHFSVKQIDALASFILEESLSPCGVRNGE